METSSFVKFKDNLEPCIIYRVVDDTPVMEYDEIALNKYTEHIKIEVLGLVPKEVLAEAKYNKHNIPAIDVAVRITNLK